MILKLLGLIQLFLHNIEQDLESARFTEQTSPRTYNFIDTCLTRCIKADNVAVMMSKYVLF
jgi:hypothetical protein